MVINQTVVWNDITTRRTVIISFRWPVWQRKDDIEVEGHVRKRGNSWYYSFEAGVVGGKRKRIERVGGRTKKEAQAALRKALVEYENAGMHFEPSEISVADYLDYWFKNYVLVNCKYNSQNAYESLIRLHIKPVFGIFKLKSVTPAMLQEFINDKYLAGFSKNHLINLMNVLSGSFKYAVYPCKFITDNPMQYVKRPKYEHSKASINRKLITPEEFNTIIERFPLGSAFYAPIMIGYYTGCRIGEVMSLTWNDIDLDKGFVTINKSIYKRRPSWYFGSTKTKSSVRTIKIGNTLATALRRHKKLQMENRLKYGEHYTVQYIDHEADQATGQELRRIISVSASVNPGVMEPANMVCTKENGQLITPESFQYASRVIHYSLGILFNFHSLRHTHATTLIENGANIKDVQRRLGHAKIETTLNTYIHATEAMAERSTEIFEAAVNKK